MSLYLLGVLKFIFKKWCKNKKFFLFLLYKTVNYGYKTAIKRKENVEARTGR